MGLLNPINPLGEMGVDMLVCGTPCSRRPDPGALRTEGRPPVTVIVDRDDDVRFTRTALAAHAPAAGRVVVHLTVAAGDRLLWHDILQALDDGRRRRPRSSRATREEQERVRTALRRAVGSLQVTVRRAHRIGPALWADLIHLHRTTTVDVVLVHHAELPDALVHLLSHSDHHVIDTFAGAAALHPPAAAPADS
ncbi:hypothetical protein AN216_00360 [Streptomyces oceani]|uniref:Uncharacterized protein n=1 Tax=Streptomyces oceani TaxID=1075402 RepID=A0A1E7KQT1_9ACTN|nr:hypothetical protein AN216_00360 [Streptomyces oceani]